MHAHTLRTLLATRLWHDLYTTCIPPVKRRKRAQLAPTISHEAKVSNHGFRGFDRVEQDIRWLDVAVYFAELVVEVGKATAGIHNLEIQRQSQRVSVIAWHSMTGRAVHCWWLLR